MRVNSWMTGSWKPHSYGFSHARPRGPTMIPKIVARGGSDRCSLSLIISENSAYIIRKDVRTRYDRCGPVGSSCDHIVVGPSNVIR
jgi:hypothetical protein